MTPELLNQIGLPLIAVIVPLIVAGIRRILPGIPKPLLPVLAGAAGPALELALSHVMATEFTGALGVAAGLAGIGIRELQDQLRKSIAKE